MKALLESEELGSDLLSFTAKQPGIGAREFHCALPCFGAGVGEEDAIEAGTLSQAQREFRLTFVIEEVRRVDKLAALFGDGFFDHGMAIAEGVDADSAEQVQIAIAFFVDDVNASPTDKEDGVAIVSLQKEFRFCCANLIEFGQL